MALVVPHAVHMVTASGKNNQLQYCNENSTCMQTVICIGTTGIVYM